MSGPHSQSQPPRTGLTTSGATSPVASPIGAGDRAASGPVRGEQGPVAVPNDVGVPASASASYRRSGRGRIGRLQRATIQRQLVERDRQILARLDEHGFLTTHQITGFVFTGHASRDTAERSTRRTLRRLERDHLIRHLPRRQGGPLGGSTPATWQLSTAGCRLIHPEKRNQRAATPSLRWLQHCLAVADTHLRLLDHAEARGLDATVTVEPDTWRRYPGTGGETRILKPDLYAQLAGSDQQGSYVDTWFVEVDRGTESIPTLLKQCRQYVDFHRSGVWQTADGCGVMPLVLWVLAGPDLVTAKRRRDQLTESISRAGALPEELFRVALPDAIADVLDGSTS